MLERRRMRYFITLLALLSSLSLQALTIGAYNIRNFDYDQRYRIHTNKPELGMMLRSLRADVLSVEEINNTKEFQQFIARELPNYGVALSNCGGSHGQRLGFIYNKQKVSLLSFNEDLSLSNPGGEGTCDQGSRPLAIGLFEIKSSKQRFYGYTAHLKSGSAPSSVTRRHQQFAMLKNIILDLSSRTGIKDYFVAGDLNTTEYISRGADYKMLNQFTKELGIVNLTEVLGCSAYWWGGADDGIEHPSLLDHVIATKGLIRNKPRAQLSGHCRSVSCQKAPTEALGVSYAEVSDHCPITATIQ
jgi:hypothetical protein